MTVLVENPLPGMAAGQELQQKPGSWVVGDPPAPQPLAVVGAYRLFD